MNIKLYIDTNSNTFPYQIANFINKKDLNDSKIIFILGETILNEERTNSHNISIVRYQQGALQKTLVSLAKFLSEINLSSLECHLESDACSKILLILLSELKIDLNILKLYIYESSITSFALRDKFSYDNGEILKNNLNVLLHNIKETLKCHKPFQGNDNELIFSSCIWHHLADTTYYAMNNIRGFSSLPVNEKVHLDNEGKVIFSEIYNIPLEVSELAREYFQQETVFYCDKLSTSHPTLKQLYEELVREHISQIINDTNNKNTALLLHHDNNPKIFNGICKSILQLPLSMNMVAMNLIDIHPKNIITKFNNIIPNSDKKSHYIIFSSTDNEETTRHQALLRKYFDIIPQNILYTNEILQHQKQGNSKRIFYSSASMGDIIYGIGAINALRHHYPSDNFVFVTNKLYADLIDNCPSKIEFWDINCLSPDQLAEIKISAELSQLHFFERWEQIVSEMHMTDAFISEVTNEIPDSHKNALLDFQNIDKLPVDKFIADNNLTSEKIVLLHPNIGSPNRTWTQHGWEALAQTFITHGWQVIFIGSDNNKYQNKKAMLIDCPHVYNAINKFSITQTVYLMSQCQLLVACDSGPVALAGYTDIAISALYSIIPSNRRLPYRHGKLGWNAQGIDVSCQYGQCGHLIMDERFYHNTLRKKWIRPDGKRFAEWCPNKKKYSCLTHFSHAQWWAEINKFIESDNFILNTRASV
ncbi:glycosyltransferase family 9 protein [Kluyvera georgiana]|uniref:glycosyltransferase family 9 protein n=1 Tax=Kluyvera georgiana TaxID=73098 RepID=UPI003D980956